MKVRGVSSSICCLLNNYFKGRDYCLMKCVCDCYEAWERMKKMEREIEEENGGARWKRTGRRRELDK